MSNNKAWSFTGRTGGTADDMDSLDVNLLSNNDLVIVNESGIVYHYRVSTGSGATADGLLVVIPITDPGNVRFLLESMAAYNPAYTANFAGGSATSTMSSANTMAWSVLATNAGAAARLVDAGQDGKQVIVYNNTGYELTVSESASSTGAKVPYRATMLLFHDGSDYRRVGGEMILAHDFDSASATWTLAGTELWADSLVCTAASGSAVVVMTGWEGRSVNLFNNTTTAITLKTSAGATGSTLTSGLIGCMVHDDADWITLSSASY